MRTDESLAWHLALVVLLAATGCGEKVVLQPVDGIVTLDGKPVADAAVLFMPVLSDGPPAHATTNSDGRFRLSTNNRSGVTAGRHRVAISKTELRRLDATSDDAAGNTPRTGFVPDDVEEKHLLPERYSDASRSELIADVQAESRNSFVFSLTSDDTMEDKGEPVDESDEPTENPSP